MMPHSKQAKPFMVKGKAAVFYLQPLLPRRAELRDMIVRGGGKVISKAADDAAAIVIADPDRYTLGKNSPPAYRAELIEESVNDGTMRLLEKYRIAAAPKARRLAWTPDEEALLLDAIVRLSSTYSTGGIKLWKEIEAEGKIKRSWQAMLFRYKTSLKKRHMQMEKQKSSAKADAVAVRKLYTAEEDEVILEAVQRLSGKYSGVNLWKQIVAEGKINRTHHSLAVRYTHHLKGKAVSKKLVEEHAVTGRNVYTAEEDEALLEAVQRLSGKYSGVNLWKQIVAEGKINRSHQSVYLRYIHHLNVDKMPELTPTPQTAARSARAAVRNRSEWSVDEKRLLLEEVQRLSNQYSGQSLWKQIEAEGKIKRSWQALQERYSQEVHNGHAQKQLASASSNVDSTDAVSDSGKVGDADIREDAAEKASSVVDSDDVVMARPQRKRGRGINDANAGSKTQQRKAKRARAARDADADDGDGIKVRPGATMTSITTGYPDRSARADTVRRLVHEIKKLCPRPVADTQVLHALYVHSGNIVNAAAFLAGHAVRPQRWSPAEDTVLRVPDAERDDATRQQVAKIAARRGAASVLQRVSFLVAG